MGYVAVLRSGGFGALATALPIVLLYAGIVPFFPSLNPDGADFTGWNIAAFYAALNTATYPIIRVYFSLAARSMGCLTLPSSSAPA